MEDTCGGFPLCCGMATGGLVKNSVGTASLETIPTLALCNKAPSANGTTKLAEPMADTLKGGDTPSTEIGWEIERDNFTCFANPVPPKLPVAGVGMSCDAIDFDCGSTDLCCGMATNGKIVTDG